MCKGDCVAKDLETAKHFSFASAGKIETVRTDLDTIVEKKLLDRSFVPFYQQVLAVLESH